MADWRAYTIYVVRHGECEHNVAGRAAARNDTPLTPRGREQARANGKLLAEIEPALDRFDFLASSLHRTCNTMELLREAAGLAPTGYRADRRLMEIDFGDFTMMTFAEIEADPRHPADRYDWDYRRPNGESWADVHARVGRFLASLAHDAVIVTHFGPARMIHAHYFGLGPSEMAGYKPSHGGVLRLQAGTEAHFGE